ncbi:MAG: response regulator transcription factor [Chloroflexota bacterium]
MTRVRVEAGSPVVRAGLEAILRAAGFELSDPGRPVDVVLAFLEDAHVPQRPDVPAVVLGDVDPGDELRRGTRAVLRRDASEEEIVAAVRAVEAGLIALPAEDLAVMGQLTSKPDELSEPLTAREIEVLGLLAEGVSNKAIAAKLAISEHTVKFHVASILAKLDAGSRTEAVIAGIRQGLVML